MTVSAEMFRQTPPNVSGVALVRAGSGTRVPPFAASTKECIKRWGSEATLLGITA